MGGLKEVKMENKHSFIYKATEGKREIHEPIDCLDESGTLALKEHKIRKEIAEQVFKDIEKVAIVNYKGMLVWNFKQKDFEKLKQKWLKEVKESC